MGFDNFLIVRAQGLQTNGIDVSKAMEQAKNDLNIEFAKFYEQ